MSPKTRFSTHEQYFASVPEGPREVLRRVQSLVETLLPQAERCISYNIPAYRIGKVFFYFAAFKNHLSIYPPVRDDAALIAATARYRNEKGNLTFKFEDAIPYPLIGRVAKALARERERDSR